MCVDNRVPVKWILSNFSLNSYTPIIIFKMFVKYYPEVIIYDLGIFEKTNI